MPNVSFNRKPTEFIAPRKSWGSTFEIGVFIVLAILIYIYLIVPKQKEYSDRKDQLKELTNDENRIRNQKQAFERLVKELKDNPDMVTKLDEVIPLDPKSSTIYVLTEYLAQSAGMTSSSIAVDAEPGTIAAGDKTTLKDSFGVDRVLLTIPVTVNAIGTMDQLTNFLSQVENSHRLMDVVNVDISQGKDQQFIFKLKLNAYAFAPQPQNENQRAAAVAPAVTSPQ